MNTFVFNFRSRSMIARDNVFSTNINVPELNNFRTLKVYVKDFIICRTSRIGNDTVYHLCSNLNFSNVKDSVFNYSSGKILCSVPYAISHFTNKGKECLILNGGFNGNIKFWIEDSDGTILNSGAGFDEVLTNDVDNFFVSLVVVGEN